MSLSSSTKATPATVDITLSAPPSPTVLLKDLDDTTDDASNSPASSVSEDEYDDDDALDIENFELHLQVSRDIDADLKAANATRGANLYEPADFEAHQKACRAAMLDLIPKYAHKTLFTPPLNECDLAFIPTKDSPSCPCSIDIDLPTITLSPVGGITTESFIRAIADYLHPVDVPLGEYGVLREVFEGGIEMECTNMMMTSEGERRMLYKRTMWIVVDGKEKEDTGTWRRYDHAHGC